MCKFNNRAQLELEVLIYAYEQFLCLQPPKFEGGTNPLKVEYWLREMEKLFETTGLEAGLRVSFATNLLIKEANHWWMVIGLALGSNQAITWAKFRRVFLEQYFPCSIEIAKGNDILY